MAHLLHTYCQSLPNFCHHQTVVSITVNGRTHQCKNKLPVWNPWTVDSWILVLVWTQQVAAHNISHSKFSGAVKQTDQWVSEYFLSQKMAVRGRTAWGVEQLQGTADLMPWNMCCPSSSSHTLQDMQLNLGHKSWPCQKELSPQQCAHTQVNVRTSVHDQFKQDSVCYMSVSFQFLRKTNARLITVVVLVVFIVVVTMGPDDCSNKWQCCQSLQ
jgi:hypothetical protein